MKRNSFFLFFFFIANAIFAQTEGQYNANDPSLPEWVKLLYQEFPDAKAVEKAYQEYYETHTFEKNQYTQYYKRWKKENLQYTNDEGIVVPPTKAERERKKQKYLNRITRHRQARNNNPAWEEIGPWEYDHEATMNISVQSPGSAHVYTVEQAKSNSNTVYAGTASAGIWKSIDKGLSWERVGKNLYLNSVYSIEIDFRNDNTLYFAGGNRIWKSTDAAASFSETGNGQWVGWVRDLKMHPGNNLVLLAATDYGLFRTADAGASWTLISGGNFMEIEFHPTNSNIVYTAKLNGNRTEFYKSTDGGISFDLKPNGWPGVASHTASGNYNALVLNDNYASAANVPLGNATYPDFTIELRVKSSGWSSDPAIIANKNWNSGYNKGFILAGNTNGSSWKFNIGDGNNRMDLNGGSINDNQWHHLAVSYSATGELRLYQDGGLVASTNTTITTNIDPLLAFGIGQDGTLNYGAAFNGELSDIRIWNTVLDEATLNTFRCITLNNTHPNYSSLLHHWKADEGNGNLLADATGNNDGNINGTANWTIDNQIVCIIPEMTGGEEQKRIEMAVSPAAPDHIYILATGNANGGSGLYGFYKSTDAGESFSYTCCGTEPGGVASIDNKNIVGYSFEGTENGGQYYYDLALDVSPTDPDKIFAAGISVNRSEDGGTNWETNGHWVTWVGSNTKTRYTHADVHDVKFFQNGANVDMWVASDGGLYYSSTQGDTITPRMHGIQGTEFWGFGSSYKEDAMVGGAYHNGTLLHYKETFLKGKNGKGGWFAGGAGDATRGLVHIADGKVMFEGGGMFEVRDRTMYWKWLPFDNSKSWNANGTPGKYGNYEWDPRYYNHFYAPSGAALWKTEDNGASFSLVHDFSTGLIYRVKIARANPDVIYVVHNDDPSDKVRIWKTLDAGESWTDITPADALVGNLNHRNKLIDIDHRDENKLWLALVGGGTDYKVFETVDGGNNWNNITGNGLDDAYLLDISYHQGTDGGLYIGTTNTVYYRNNISSDWQFYNNNLPVATRCGYLYPNYTKQKLRMGTYSGAYQVDLVEHAPPVAKISVDKKSTDCVRDSFYFKDLSYVSENNRTWAWSFPGGIPESSTEENPVVVFPEPGTYSASLTITDAYGSDSWTLTDLVTVYPSDCKMDTIPGKALQPDVSGYVNLGRSEDLNFKGNDPFTFMAWIKASEANMTGFILSKYDRYVAGQFQFGIEEGRLITTREVWPYTATGATAILADQWYHVATTYDGLQLKVYVNGVLDGSVDMLGGTGSIGRDLLIGARHRSGNIEDHFKGLIEELSVWNKALTQAAIRELRHLTLDKIQGDGLVAYYQFNESDTIIFDKAKFHHGSLEAGANLFNSTCPVGGGYSYRLDVNNGGLYDFANTGIRLTFPETGIYPDGELLGFRLNVLPDEVPGLPTIPAQGYWIINNYGNNPTFDALASLELGSISVSPLEADNPGIFKLYKRGSNEDGTTWGNGISSNMAFTGNVPDGSIHYSSQNNINSFSQFIIQKETCPDTLLVHISPITGDTLRAAVVLRSNGEEFSGSDIIFHAGNSIELGAGFTVKSGAAFLAEIRACVATTNVIVNDPKGLLPEEVDLFLNVPKK